MSDYNFKRDVELDAALVMAGMRGGFHAVCSAAMSLGLSGPDEVLKRADWMKADEEYANEVVQTVLKIEKKVSDERT